MVEASALNKDAIRGMLFSLGFDGAIAHQVIGALPARAVAVLLYGSRARGDIHEHSDVDVLVVAEEFARTRAIGPVNTSTYAPEQIENAAGTLFGTHLARDGVVLHEHDGWLTDLLKRFEPTDPAQVLNRVQQLAVALRSDEASRTRYVSGLVRLARYLLRTAFYAKALDPGPPCFSISGLAERFCQPELTILLSSHETTFKMILPLTTAVTQVVMMRAGSSSVGVPSNLVETVRRIPAKELQQAYNSGVFDVAGGSIPFFWSGALLQTSPRSTEPQGKTATVTIFQSAAQRIAMHVDEVLGNQEVVVKNLGPQLSRLPGLAGMSILASGAVALIYNPVALASVYGQQARAWGTDSAEPHMLEQGNLAVGGDLAKASAKPAASQIPLILVVDDSITVRRVTQRLLQREGYRVSMAADGLQALERLQEERPTVVLSDIEMPRMDGFDLARNIRGDARLSDLPIIMITSRIAEKHRVHAMELGVDHYLGKPYAEDELLSLIRHYASAVTPA